MSTGARFVSVSKAAEIVSESEGQRVDRSTLSRYIKRYASEITPRREGRETLIDVNALLAHRGINIRVERGSTLPFAKDVKAASAKERKTDIDVRIAEIELEREEEKRARERGQMVDVADLAAAAEAAIQAFGAALDEAETDAAEDIARRTRSEARHVRPGLRVLKRVALEAFRRELLAAIPSPEVDVPSR